MQVPVLSSKDRPAQIAAAITFWSVLLQSGKGFTGPDGRQKTIEVCRQPCYTG